jgi:hypothetical protein
VFVVGVDVNAVVKVCATSSIIILKEYERCFNNTSKEIEEFRQ